MNDSPDITAAVDADTTSCGDPLARPTEELGAECGCATGITVRFSHDLDHPPDTPCARFVSTCDALEMLQYVSLDGSDSLDTDDLAEALTRYLPECTSLSLCRDCGRIVSLVIQPPAAIDLAPLADDRVLCGEADTGERRAAVEAIGGAYELGANPSAFVPALWILPIFKIATRIAIGT